MEGRGEGEHQVSSASTLARQVSRPRRAPPWRGDERAQSLRQAAFLRSTVVQSRRLREEHRSEREGRRVTEERRHHEEERELLHAKGTEWLNECGRGFACLELERRGERRRKRVALIRRSSSRQDEGRRDSGMRDFFQTNVAQLQPPFEALFELNTSAMHCKRTRARSLQQLWLFDVSTHTFGSK